MRVHADSKPHARPRGTHGVDAGKFHRRDRVEDTHGVSDTRVPGARGDVGEVVDEVVPGNM